MSVNVLGCQFDDSDEQVAEALETIIFHMNEDYDILYDYLACCEKFDVVPSTIEELASCVLSPDLNCYVQTNFDYPQGYPAEDIAYEDIGHYMLDETDLWNHLRKDHLDYYFDFEQYGHDYIQNNGSKLGAYGFLAAPPSTHIIISKDEIIELANYLSGRAYESTEIDKILHSINADILDCGQVAKLNPTDYWIIEFNETDEDSLSYKGRVITSALIDEIKCLDAYRAEQNKYELYADHQKSCLKFYFDHIEKGKTTEHIRMDIGDNDDYNHQFFADLKGRVQDALQAQNKPPEERKSSTLSEDLQAARAAANRQTQQPVSHQQSHNQKV